MKTLMILQSCYTLASKQIIQKFNISAGLVHHHHHLIPQCTTNHTLLNNLLEHGSRGLNPGQLCLVSINFSLFLTFCAILY